MDPRRDLLITLGTPRFRENCRVRPSERFLTPLRERDREREGGRGRGEGMRCVYTWERIPRSADLDAREILS